MKKGNLSFTFMIPNVSLLLIYRDNWNKSNVMRKVIAELLRKGFYKALYIGNKTEFQCTHYMWGFKDCSIVSLKLSGAEYLNSANKDELQIFADELENKRNVLHFDPSVLSEMNQVTYIDIGIRINKTLQTQQEETAAA